MEYINLGSGGVQIGTMHIKQSLSIWAVCVCVFAAILLCTILLMPSPTDLFPSLIIVWHAVMVRQTAIAIQYASIMTIGQHVCLVMLHKAFSNVFEVELET